MNDRFSLARIESDVRRLASSPRHSGENPREHRAAGDWIAAELQIAGCRVDFQEFDIPGQDPPRRGRNVIGMRAGDIESRPAVLIGAHCDTVPGSPGADDNASGVAAMLECARLLKDAAPRRPVIFAAFDGEEKQPPAEGLHGSTAFVEARRQSLLPWGEGQSLPRTGSGGEGEASANGMSGLTAAIILESIGYCSPPRTQTFPAGFQLLFPRAFDVARQSGLAGDSLAILSNVTSRPLARRFEQAASKAGLPTLPVELPGWMRVPYNLRRSDHAPFWAAGIPAIMVGDTANFRNPNYHLPSDTPDTLDYDMIARVVETLTAIVAG